MSKKVMLFLGSGVAYKTGLPTTRQITDRLLNGWWWRHTDERFYSEGRPGVGSIPITPRLQSFLKILMAHTDAYAALKFAPTGTYEDLYYLCQQIKDEEDGEIDNPGMRPFVDLLRREIEPICQPYSPPNQDRTENLQTLATAALQLIECVVEQMLATKDHPLGLELVKEFAQASDIQLTISTLNHDVLIERLLETAAIPFADGYGQPSPDVCWFDPRILEVADTKVKLLKLHGSINWRRWASKNQKGWAKMPTNGAREYPRDPQGAVLIEYPQSGCLIGTYNKVSSYNYGVLAHLHTKFFLLLQDHAVVVMSGYGWNDRWINGRLMEWLDLSPQNKIVLLHTRPEELRTSKSAMWHRYDKLFENGQLLLIRKWLSDTRLAGILPLMEAAGT